MSCTSRPRDAKSVATNIRTLPIVSMTGREWEFMEQTENILQSIAFLAYHAVIILNTK